MQEKTLSLIALLCTIAGLLFLYLYSDQVDPRLPNQVELAHVEELVQLKGVVTGIQTTPKATFFTLQGERIENTKVILFNKDAVFLEEGDYVELKGLVEEYQGQKEVVASVITKK